MLISLATYACRMMIWLSSNGSRTSLRNHSRARTWKSFTSAHEPCHASGRRAFSRFPLQKESPEVVAGGCSDGRKCLHCATDKTPQWRTGPMGPKTLCNACGVRYKSGRLVPEYRPAASPTFVLTKHSNSHRKVLELRRQKEMVRSQHQHQQQQFLHHQNMVFDFLLCLIWQVLKPIFHNFSNFFIFSSYHVLHMNF
ncbi:unnamed protein product, partial [Vitis vinifera]